MERLILFVEGIGKGSVEYSCLVLKAAQELVSMVCAPAVHSFAQLCRFLLLTLNVKLFSHTSTAL